VGIVQSIHFLLRLFFVWRQSHEDGGRIVEQGNTLAVISTPFTQQYTENSNLRRLCSRFWSTRTHLCSDENDAVSAFASERQQSPAGRRRLPIRMLGRCQVNRYSPASTSPFRYRIRPYPSATLGNALRSLLFYRLLQPNQNTRYCRIILAIVIIPSAR